MSTWAQATSQLFSNPYSPLSYTLYSRRLAASYDLLYRLACDFLVPAVRARARRGFADGRASGSGAAQDDDDDGRPDRYAAQSDPGQRAGQAQVARLVPQHRGLQGAVVLSRLPAGGLPGLPAA